MVCTIVSAIWTVVVFFQVGGICIEPIEVEPVLMQPTPMSTFYGNGSMYSEGVMESTIEVRVAGETHYSLPESVWDYDLWLAVLFSDWCYLIGSEIVATFEDGSREIGMVTDCGNELHTARHLEMWGDGIIGELDYWTYQEHYQDGVRMTVDIPSLRE